MRNNRKILLFIVVFFLIITGYFAIKVLSRESVSKPPTATTFEELVETVTEGAVSVVGEEPASVEKEKPTSKPTKNPDSVNTPVPTKKVEDKKTTVTKEVVTPKPTDKVVVKVTPKVIATSTPVPTLVPEKEGTCSIVIQCKTILQHADPLPSHIPKTGILLSVKNVKFTKNDSVYQIVKRECEKNHILFVSDLTGYVQGIGNVFDKDFGSESGWMYRVNGRFPNVGVKGYKASSNDQIEFVYTCERGDI